MICFIRFNFLLFIFTGYNLAAQSVNVHEEEPSVLTVSRKKILSRADFENDFLKIFPYYSFKLTNLYDQIAYFEIFANSNNFQRIFSSMERLKEKYRNNLNVLREILFFQHLLCYGFLSSSSFLGPSKEVSLSYQQIAKELLELWSYDSHFVGDFFKIQFLIQNKILPNESHYCIGVKEDDYLALVEKNLNDPLIDQMYELMVVSRELLNLKIFERALTSSYGVNWVEGLWFSLGVLGELTDENYMKGPNADVFFYFIVEFFVSQKLFSPAKEVLQAMSVFCPSSYLTALASNLVG